MGNTLRIQDIYNPLISLLTPCHTHSYSYLPLPWLTLSFFLPLSYLTLSSASSFSTLYFSFPFLTYLSFLHTPLATHSCSFVNSPLSISTPSLTHLPLYLPPHFPPTALWGSGEGPLPSLGQVLRAAFSLGEWSRGRGDPTDESQGAQRLQAALLAGVWNCGVVW